MCVFCSSSFYWSGDGRQMTVKLLFCEMLLPGFYINMIHTYIHRHLLTDSLENNRKLYVHIYIYIYIYIYIDPFHIKEKSLKLLIFFVIIFISADHIFFLNVRSASSDKDRDKKLTRFNGVTLKVSVKKIFRRLSTNSPYQLLVFPPCFI